MKNPFPRELEPEILDHLTEDDPRAIRSRKDLQRINRIMGSAGVVAATLLQNHSGPKHMIELGAGDGTWMLRLARYLAPSWPRIHITLLDRQNLLNEETRQGFAQLGWSVEFAKADVLDWIKHPPSVQADIGIANLFIHHFDYWQIQDVFEALSKRIDLFVACEPRRAVVPLWASRLVGLIGANEVTRADAVSSVKAGFRGAELSAQWHVVAPEWILEEGPARLFNHLFVARRKTLFYPMCPYA